MIVRRVADVPPVEWGHGLSRRLLLAEDNLGFSLTDTIVDAGTTSAMQYARHLEACYCIEGTGYVLAGTERRFHSLEPGVMYALDQHEPHQLVANREQDLRLICVFVPALDGHERHNLTEQGFSCY